MEHVRRQQGFTLIELAVALTVLLILLAVGLPDFSTTNDKRRLQGAAEALQQDLRFARTEAIKRNQSVTVAFDDAQWCWGMVLGSAGCDCGSTDCVIDGVLRVRNSSDYTGIAISAITFSGDETTINPTHGTAGAGTVTFQSPRGIQANVVLSGLGRVRICSPTSNNKYGFESC